MQFNKDVIPYLEGHNFSNGLRLKISVKEDKIIYRLDLLEEIAKGKSIIHIGFADHMPLIPKKIEKNIWLHKRLLDASKICVGIDIDSKVVEYVQNELKIENVFCLNVIKDEIPDEIKQEKFDFLVLGEVLEHIDNPVEFLSSIREKFMGIANKMIITVPNAWDLTNLRLLNSGVEFINTDHRYWFTPFTLAKVGFRSGLKINSFYFAQNYPVFRRFKKLILKRFPNTRETIIMIFDL